MTPQNTYVPTRKTDTRSRIDSSVCGRFHSHRGFSVQSTASGATMRSPTASPSHHVSQIGPELHMEARPKRQRLATPSGALIVVLPIPARRARRKTSPDRSKTRRPRANLLTSHAPATPSSVLPSAMPIEGATEPVVVRFTRKAPRKIPGQTSRPKTTSAASAIPVGAQTAVALSLTKARVNPSLPAIRYTRVMKRLIRAVRNRLCGIVRSPRSRRCPLEGRGAACVLKIRQGKTYPRPRSVQVRRKSGGYWEEGKSRLAQPSGYEIRTGERNDSDDSGVT